MSTVNRVIELPESLDEWVQSYLERHPTMSQDALMVIALSEFLGNQ